LKLAHNPAGVQVAHEFTDSMPVGVVVYGKDYLLFKHVVGSFMFGLCGCTTALISLLIKENSVRHDGFQDGLNVCI
jgi:hypothetical protein